MKINVDLACVCEYCHAYDISENERDVHRLGQCILDRAFRQASALTPSRN